MRNDMRMATSLETPCKRMPMIREQLAILEKEIACLMEVRQETENRLSPILRLEPTVETTLKGCPHEDFPVHMAAEINNLIMMLRGVISDMNRMLDRVEV